MMRKSTIPWVAAGVLVVAGAVLFSRASAQAPAQTVVVQWNSAVLKAVQATAAPPTVVARQLAIIHTAMFDAWAAYDNTAIGSLPNSPFRQPTSARTAANKTKAASYAAFIASTDLFPTQRAIFTSLMTSLGYDPAVYSFDSSTPEGIGNWAASVLLSYRHADGSNQLGDLGGSGPYTDYTGYVAVNFPDNLTDPNHWQPVRAADGTVQKFLSPHWGRVKPFALSASNQFRPGPPPQAGSWLYDQRMRDTVRLGAELDDRAKMSAEFWNDAPGSVTPPGHWNEFAQDISIRDKHTLDDDIKMFFALNNAELDTSIAVWDAKRTYDAIRPQSAIRYWYKGTQVTGWFPGKGIGPISGENWTAWIPTPPHPEYPSGHSAFSSAGAQILRNFTAGSDVYSKQIVFPKGSSSIDPNNSPAQATTLTWQTFSEVADDAGYSRRAGGIHYDEADYRSRTIGRQVANVVWDRYSQLLGQAAQ